MTREEFTRRRNIISDNAGVLETTACCVCGSDRGLQPRINLGWVKHDKCDAAYATWFYRIEKELNDASF